MITANLKGGLGNQLFQIAAAYALALRLTHRYEASTAGFHCRSGKKHPSNYPSILGGVPMTGRASPSQVIHEPPTVRGLTDRALALGGDVVLDGYFQSHHYFADHEDDVRRLFMRVNPVAWLMNNSTLFRDHPELRVENDFCFLGVRRGDYLQFADFHKPCGMDYYRKAIATLDKERYYVVSDDLDWCRRNLAGPQFVFLDYDDTTQFHAGQLFRNYIIANSSFHWWTSYLSLHSQPTAVAPDMWIAGATDAIYRPGMMVVKRLVETA